MLSRLVGGTMYLVFLFACAQPDQWSDYDGDGYVTCYYETLTGRSLEQCDPIDCDDTRAEVYPAAEPSCEGGTDHDCDGKADYLDLLDCDHDGVPGAYELAYCGIEAVTNSRVSPEMGEFCDGIDNDCDGVIDDGCEEGA